MEDRHDRRSGKTDVWFKLHMLHRFWRFRLRKEKEQLACVRHLKLRKTTVLDIGANKGVYSYWLSRAVGNRGRVFAFEPQPELQSHLRRLKSGFELDNLSIADVALSDVSGVTSLFRDFSGAGHASFEPDQMRNEAISVLRTRLDCFAKDHGLDDIAFIKLDVEGHELQVLKGAENTLLESHPLVLVESHTGKDGGDRVFEFLSNMDYVAHSLVPGTGRLGAPQGGGGQKGNAFLFGPSTARQRIQFD